MSNPASSSLDAALMATMTDEERAAINDADEGEIDSLKATGAQKDPVHKAGEMDKPAAAGPEDEDEDEDDDGVDEKPAAAATETPPAAKADDAAAVEAKPQDTAPQPAGFTYRFELPADFEERTNAAKTAEKEIYDKLKEGELTVEELPERLAAVREQQRELDAIRTKHEIAVQSQQQSMETTRQAAIQRLFDQAKSTDGVDYAADKGKMGDLDVFVRALASNPANEDKPLAWFLDEAHKRVKTLHGVAAPPKDEPKPAAAVKTPAEIKAVAAAARKVDMTDVPKDLAGVPGGDGPGDVGGEFQDVMDLEGDAFEAAITRMAKTQPERWARFQQQSQ